MKIAILTRDSLYSHLVIEPLIRTFQEEIALICSSSGYGHKRQRLVPAALGILRRSGFEFLAFLALYLLVYKFFILLNLLANKVLGIRRKLFFLSELTRPYGIRIQKVLDINSPSSRKMMEGIQPDLIISIYFDQWVSSEVLKIPRLGCINLHHAYLPEFAGPFPNFWALLMKRGRVGVTVHYMNEDLDAGDIIAQEEIKVAAADTVMSLDIQAHRIGTRLLIDVVERMKRGTIVAFPQDRARRTYFSYPSKSEVAKFKDGGGKLFRFKDYLSCFFLKRPMLRMI